MKTIPLTLVIEDDLSLDVANRIVRETENPFYIDRVFPDISRQKASRGSGYVFKRINGFNRAAQFTKYLILTDLDQNECAPALISTLLKKEKHPNLSLRIAVREVESWLIADRINLADYFGISQDIVEPEPETLLDPKNHIFTLAKRSRKRDIKTGIPPEDSTARIGAMYNPLLRDFVQTSWDFRAAMKNSDSLRRFVREFDKE